MVTKYVRRGLAVRSDGLIDWESAQQWHREYVVPELSGSYRARHLVSEKASPRPAIGDRSREDEISRAAIRRLVNLLVTESARIPELMLQMSVSDIDLAAAAQDGFVDFVTVLGAALIDQAVNWSIEDIERAPVPDLEALAKLYKVPAPDPEKRERYLSLLDGVLWDHVKTVQGKGNSKTNAM